MENNETYATLIDADNTTPAMEPNTTPGIPVESNASYTATQVESNVTDPTTSMAVTDTDPLASFSVDPTTAYVSSQEDEYI